MGRIPDEGAVGEDPYAGRAFRCRRGAGGEKVREGLGAVGVGEEDEVGEAFGDEAVEAAIGEHFAGDDLRCGRRLGWRECHRISIRMCERTA